MTNGKQSVMKQMIVISLLLVSFSLKAQSNLVDKDFAKTFVPKDSLFVTPFVDVDEWREKPIRHRYVHGGFRGTETKFSFYFPPSEKYKARFFQYITPIPDNENLAQQKTGESDMISFSVESGAYFVETNGGGRQGMGMMSGSDPTIGAFRANAACAQFSRTVANQIYNDNKRPYGYSYGGSGGAYRTIGGIENTEGVWDGAVPMVMGSHVAIPNVFTVRMHAMRILRDKFPQIIDALEPGGSGDMYAGLNEEEISALKEVTKMGFPPKSWFGYKTMGMHGFVVLYQTIYMIDKQYFDHDFWSSEGYLGSYPPPSLINDRVKISGKIKRGIAAKEAVSLKLIEPISENERGTSDLAWKNIGGKEGEMPVVFELDGTIPNKYFLGGDLLIKTGEGAGRSLFVTTISGNYVILGPTDPKQLMGIKPGDEVTVDNSNFLAVQTYHRHQVPSKEYHVWDQFRDAQGNPIYPQRPMQLGPLFTQGASGVLPTGKIKSKVILLSSLWDREAFPWQADWYKSKVKENLGDSTDSYVRLWYTDHALHGEPEDLTRTVSYGGVAQQALLDLSNWVEKGISPPASTNYKVEDGQVIVPTSAIDRKGIQPTITLKANGANRAEVKVGQSVKFVGLVELPKGTGDIISGEWDFQEDAKFSEHAILKKGKNSQITINATHSFAQPGTYFVTLRVAAERNGNKKSQFAHIQNLERVRVVVTK